VVLRILDREKSIMPLEQMGFTRRARELQLMMARPRDSCGDRPTGSGKTTTLYSCCRTEQRDRQI